MRLQVLRRTRAFEVVRAVAMCRASKLQAAFVACVACLQAGAMLCVRRTLRPLPPHLCSNLPLRVSHTTFLHQGSPLRHSTCGSNFLWRSSRLPALPHTFYSRNIKRLGGYMCRHGPQHARRAAAAASPPPPLPSHPPQRVFTAPQRRWWGWRGWSPSSGRSSHKQPRCTTL